MSTRTDVAAAIARWDGAHGYAHHLVEEQAFFAQSAIAFGLALVTMLIGIFYLAGDPWPKAFLLLGTLFLTTSSFTLAKCVRDAQETQYVVSRLDQARVDRILAEHDPWKEVA